MGIELFSSLIPPTKWSLHTRELAVGLNEHSREMFFLPSTLLNPIGWKSIVSNRTGSCLCLAAMVIATWHATRVVRHYLGYNTDADKHMRGIKHYKIIKTVD